MVTVCLQCGDIGIFNALTFCIKCRDCAVHRYCMKEWPLSLNVDGTWFCEDCKSNVAKESNLGKTSSVPSSCRVFIDSKEVQPNRSIRRTSKRKSGERNKSKRRLKRIRKGMTGFVASNDAHITEGSPSEHEPNCRENFDEDEKPENEWRLVLRDEEESLRPSIVPVDGVNPITIFEQGFNYAAQAQPIIDPMWKGDLICYKGFKTVYRLLALAHLSSLACSKVHEVAKLLPGVIFLELLDRSSLWPKSFEMLGPSHLSIALYFFPDNERDEQNFDRLVNNMIQQNLAMRAVTENAELLVFTSSVLPVQYRRFQRKYYLWGVFRRKQTLQLTNVAHGGEQEQCKALTCFNQSKMSALSNSGNYASDPLHSICM